MVSFILTLKRLVSGLFRAFKQRNFVALFVLIIIMLFSGTMFYTKQEACRSLMRSTSAWRP
ncbi:potassium channel protein [Paenibacillus sp. JCM 10914]|nr:potassium channel protein [Paenibacillus sp. JCM 10914]